METATAETSQLWLKTLATLARCRVEVPTRSRCPRMDAPSGPLEEGTTVCRPTKGSMTLSPKYITLVFFPVFVSDYQSETCFLAGKLGHGDTNRVYKPKVVEALQGMFIRKVCAGSQSSLALTSTGQVGLRSCLVSQNRTHFQCSTTALLS